MKEYTINAGYVILDENSEIINWADTLEEAEKIVEELENDQEENMVCEWCDEGLCAYYGSPEEQQEEETQWPCMGTEAEMQVCGQIKRGVV